MGLAELHLLALAVQQVAVLAVHQVTEAVDAVVNLINSAIHEETRTYCYF